MDNQEKFWLIDKLYIFQSFLVIEDVDSAFGGRHDGVIQHNPVYDGLSRVTMSGLLNAVDGVLKIFFEFFKISSVWR